MGLVFALANVAVPATAMAASVPSIISYQGRLTDASGNLLGGSGTTYYFKFSLWNNPTVGSGTRLWPASAPSTTQLNVKQGVFNANIGDTANGYPDALNYNFTTSNVYLQVEVSSNGSSFETLSPRQQVSSSAYAQVAGAVTGTEQSSIGTTTPASDAVATIESTTTNAVALVVRGTTGQTAKILDVRDSLASSLFSVNASGGVSASSTLQVTGATTLYGTLAAATASFTGITNTGLSTLSGGILSNSASSTITNLTAINATSTNATTTSLYIAGQIRGAGLVSCSGSSSKLIWNSTTGQFGCGVDAGGSGSGLTAIGAQYSSYQTGATQTLATTSDANIQLTITSVGDTHTFSPSWVGTLAVGRGGTGLSSVTDNQLLVGGPGNTIAQIATSSLGLLTTDVAEGSNLYYTPARVDARINATTSLGTLTDLPNLARSTTTEATTTNFAVTSVQNSLLKTNGNGSVVAAIAGQDYAAVSQLWSTTSTDYYKSVNNFFSTTSANYWDSTLSRWSTTSSDYFLSQRSTTNLPEGSNLYYTDARVDARINATTTLGTLQFLPNLVSATTTNATTSNLAILNIPGSLLKTNANGSVVAAIAGSDYAKASDIIGKAFELSGGYLAPTTSQTILANNGFVSQASSTVVGNFTITGNSTTTNATTTALAISSVPNSLLKTNGQGSILAAVAGTDYATIAQLWATTSADYYNSQFRNFSISGGYLAPTTSIALRFPAGFVSQASSTNVGNFTITGNSTTTNATTTALAISSINNSLLKTNGNGSIVAAIAGSDYAKASDIIGKAWEITNGYLAPTSTIGIIVNAASSTITNLLAANATSTNATSTNLTVSSNLKLSSLSDGCLSTVGGLVTSSGSPCGAGTGSWATSSNDYYASQFRDFSISGGYLAPTTSIALRFPAGFVSQASSTNVGNFTITGNATATNATTTALAISSINNSLLKTNGNGSVVAAIAGSDYAKATDIIGKAFELSGGYLAPTTSQTILANNGFVSQASSTIVGNFTITGNATATNATTSNLYVSGTVRGAGLVSCSSSASKLVWDSSTGLFGCGVDAGAGGGITAIGAQYSPAQTGSSQTLATTSDTNIQLTITSLGDTHTFSPSWVGTLAAGRGGTGISNPSAAGILVGSYAGGSWQQIGTSSLGLLTTNVAEGSNLYYTDARVDARINATTTLGTLQFLPNLVSATTTNATTSNLAILNIPGSLLKTNANGSVVAAVAGSDYAKATDIIGKAWEITNGYLAPTTTLGVLVNAASSTITNLQVVNGTTTNATSTNLAVSSIGSGSLVKTTTGGLLVAATAGTDFATPAQLWATTSENYYTSLFNAFTVQGNGYLAPTTTRGIIVNASSTINANLVISGNSTTTNATTTALAISSIPSSLLKTNANGSIVPAISGADYANLSQVFGKAFELSGGYLAPTTSQTILANNGFVSQASSTVVGNLNITGNSTTTNATTTALAVSSIPNALLKTNGQGSILAAVAGQDYATIAQLWATTSSDYYASQFRAFSVQGNGYLAPTTSRAVLINNGTSTITNLQVVNGTTTNATSTNLAVSSIGSGSLVKTSTGGLLVAAVSGADYANLSQVFGKAFELSGGYLAPTTSQTILANNGFVSQASSTVVGNFTITGNATATNATTTAFAISSINNSLLKTNANGSILAAIAGSDYAKASDIIGKAWEITNGYLAPTSTAFGILVNNATSTITNLQVVNGTTTNATSTNLAVSSIGSGSLVKTSTGGLLVAATAGTDFATPSQLWATTSADYYNSQFRNFSVSGGYLAPTTSRAILINNGTSTITNLQVVNGTTTNATSTNLAVSSIGSGSLVKTSTGGLLVAATAGTDFATIAQLWATTSADYYASLFNALTVQGNGGYLAPTTSRPIIVNNGTSTITNLQIVNGTTTNATSTNLAVSSIGSGSLVKTSTGGLLVAATAGTDFATISQLWATTSENYFVSQFRDWSLQGSPLYLAPTTSRAILINNGTSTITNLQVVNGTTTNATSTNLAITGVTSSLLKTNGNGLVVGAVPGQDYLNSTFRDWFINSAGFLSPTSTIGLVIPNGSANIGLGTTTPWGAVSVGNSVGGTEPIFVVASSSGALATSTAFIVDQFGNVGVSTTSPSAAFAVNGLIYSGLSGYKFPDGTVQTTASTGGGGYATIQSGGSGLTQRTIVNFTGSGISCVDNSGNTRTDCTVNAGAASAGGVNGQVQFNDSNALGGANVNYVKTTGNLGVGTTSPLGRLSVSSANSVTSQPLFIIASSSLAIATTTPFIVTNEGDVGIGSSSPAAQLSVVDNSANTATIINQQGTGNLFSLQQAGTDKFTVGNNGSLTISATTNDLVKSTTGSSKPSDFSLAGSTLNDVTSSGDLITINDSSTTPTGPIGNGMVNVSATTTPSAQGAGGHVILRDDGQYLVIHGGSTAVSVWNGYSSTMTPLADSVNGKATLLTGVVGAGAISLRRPDGRYLVIHGGGLNTSTILDPYGRFPSQAGPTANFCASANTGTNAFQRPDGRYVVMCGGVAGGTTAIYDPNANTFTTGPTTGTTFGAGAHSIQRDNGTFLVFAGGGTTGNFIYNPNLSATNIGAFTNINPITTNAPTISAGAFSIRRADGKFLVLGGAINTSSIYDPSETASTTNQGAGTMAAQSGSGFGPTAALADGAQVMWRQDGTYLLLIGTGSAVTNIIDPSQTGSSQFTAGPNLGGNLGSGAVTFMRPNGHYAVIRGGGTAMDDYDMGYIIGGTSTTAGELNAYYETECMSAPGLNPQSTLTWHVANEGTYVFQTKTGTGSCSGSYDTIQNSGDTIKPDNTTDDHIQVKVYFQRSLPKFYDQEWNIRKSGQTRYRRNALDPALYDFTINNNSLFKRNFIDFAQNTQATSTATSSIPITVNLQIKTDGVGLAFSQVSNPEYNTTVNATNAANFNAAFATSTSLIYGVASSTVVMKRPDGKFVILAGSTTLSTFISPAQLYDPDTKSITNLGASPTTNIGVGALAFKRPDGKFLIVMGNATGNSTAGTGTTTTNIYDPITNTFSYGPPLTGNAGRGALVIPLPTGKFLIMHGSFTTGSTIYDPFQNSTIQGPLALNVIGGGSMALPRPNGTYLLIPGATTETCTPATATNLFDPNQMLFRANPNVVLVTGTGPGATAFQRTDGLYVIVKGGATTNTCQFIGTTHLYNPDTNRMIAGPSLNVTLPSGGLKPEGTIAMPMADGQWLVMIGAASTTKSQIYIEKGGAGEAATEDIPTGGTQGVWYTGVGGPTAVGTSTLQTNFGFGQYLGTGPGAVAFQQPDGKFFLIAGSASTTATSTVTNLVDTGWVASGLYKTEEMNIKDLDSSSVLNWKVTPSYAGVSAEVRTAPSQAALQTSPARSIATSGSKINPNPGDTWIQVAFNFKRSFPSYKGVYTDVWYDGATPIATQRDLVQPVLTEISVTKDIDFLNLQADGATMLRISSNGNLYAADGATLNTSGADLAERYTSQVPLEDGTVVSIDPQNNHGVMPTKYQYQPDALGVVSTDPGFVAGAYTEDSYPIALIGRVPVKVSTENGLIRTGDKLTPSSVPGYAMKATLAGHIIGHALESFDPNATTTGECPESDIQIAGRQCGTIMMFVNLMDYLGEPVNDALSLSGVTLATSATTSVDGSTGSSTDISVSPQGQVLSFLEGLKAERADSAAARSEVFADKVNAISEIVSPTIFTDSLTANSIDGLTILTTKKVAADEVSTSLITSQNLDVNLSEGGIFRILKASTMIAGVAVSDASSTDATSTDATSTPIEIATTTVAISFDTSGNGFFSGMLSASGLTVTSLTVSGPAAFDGLTVSAIGTASSSLDLLGDVNFFGRPYFTTDTAGSAVIRAGKKSVDITFDRDYIETPIVSATIALEAASSSDADAQTIFDQDVRFLVMRKNVHGFTILLNKAAPTDMGFSWIALAVKNAKLFTSVDEDVLAPTSTPAVSTGLVSPPPLPISTSTPTISSGLSSTPTSTPDVTSPSSTPDISPPVSSDSSATPATTTPPTSTPVTDNASTSPQDAIPPVNMSTSSDSTIVDQSASTTP